MPSIPKKDWRQIYPRDCYRVLLVISGETGISFPKLVNIVLREGLIRLGKISESTSQASLLVKKPFESTQAPTAEQSKEQKLLEDQDQQFKKVVEQWDQHPSEEWRADWFARAEKWKDKLESARLVLARKESAT